MATEIVDYLFYLHYLTAATHSDNKYSYLSTYGYLLLKYPLFSSFPELYIYMYVYINFLSLSDLLPHCNIPLPATCSAPAKPWPTVGKTVNIH